MSRAMQNCETRLDLFPSGEPSVPTEYCARIPFRHINIEGQTLPDYIKERGASLKDVVLLPVKIVPNDTKDALFYVKFAEERIPVKSTQIDHFQTFCYWIGVYGDCSPIDVLRKLGHWSVNESTPNKIFVECRLIRESPYHFKNESLYYFSLGWHQVLPLHILDQAKRNGWRLEMAPFSKCKGESLSDIYCSNGYLCHLTNIPINYYSIGEEESRLEKTVYVDIRDFRNMYIFFQHQIQLFCSEGRACRSLLDLFDAMLATKARWHVDTRNELIYLPCIEKPPERFYRLIKMKHSGKGIPSLHSFAGSSRFVERIKNLFPCHKEVSSDVLAREAMRRMKSAGIWPQRSENGLVVEKNCIFCMIPSVLSY